MHFFSPDDIASATGLSRESVYRYRREIAGRNLKEPLPDAWPLEKPDAEKFIEYIQKRARKKLINPQ